MIGYLRGTLRERTGGRLILDVGGVGYVVDAPASTLLQLPAEGEPVELHVSTHVREDALLLFGFLTRVEQSVFDLLVSVSGVGPRIALAALSALGPETVARAVREGDVARLGTVPGVGRKTAERLVVDLRDRVTPGLAGAAPGPAEAEAPAGGMDVVSALENLGYPRRQAERAVRQAGGSGGSDSSFDDLLREALRRLSRA